MGFFKKTTDVEWLTFRENDWKKAQEIILAKGRHVDLVKDTETVDSKEIVTYTVLMHLTRDEAIDMYSQLLAKGINKFTDNNKKEETNKK